MPSYSQWAARFIPAVAVLGLSYRNIEYVNTAFLRRQVVGALIEHSSTVQKGQGLQTSATQVTSCFVPQRRPKANTVLQKPFLNVGFPKAGSTTLASFFRCGGQKQVSHFHCKSEFNRTSIPCGACMKTAVDMGEPPLQSCGGFESFNELNYVRYPPCVWPQIDYLEQIHEEKPHATFVFVFRDVASWIDSVNRWLERDGKNLRNALVNKCDVTGFPSGVGATDEEMKQFYCDQVNRIRDFVDQHPTHELVEVQLEDPNTPSIMSEHFQMNESCWGHKLPQKRSSHTTLVQTTSKK